MSGGWMKWEVWGWQGRESTGADGNGAGGGSGEWRRHKLFWQLPGSPTAVPATSHRCHQSIPIRQHQFLYLWPVCLLNSVILCSHRATGRSHAQGNQRIANWRWAWGQGWPVPTGGRWGHRAGNRHILTRFGDRPPPARGCFRVSSSWRGLQAQVLHFACVVQTIQSIGVNFKGSFWQRRILRCIVCKWCPVQSLQHLLWDGEACPAEGQNRLIREPHLALEAKLRNQGKKFRSPNRKHFIANCIVAGSGKVFLLEVLFFVFLHFTAPSLHFFLIEIR